MAFTVHPYRMTALHSAPTTKVAQATAPPAQPRVLNSRTTPFTTAAMSGKLTKLLVFPRAIKKAKTLVSLLFQQRARLAFVSNLLG